ncbi:MAG: FkbM family methyltransferase [Acidobacteriota bacterium]|nr:FkbM family methyltransferase [Acidobacteriota bacterium]
MKGRSLLARAVRVPLRWLPATAVVRAPAGPLRGLRWMPASMAHGAWLGRVEPDQLRECLRRLRPGDVLWDIGANVGLYTLPAARRVGAAGHVYAFEPIPRNLEYLQRHVELNRVDNVTVVAAAVGDREGTVRMAPGDFPAEYHVDEAGQIVVEAIALDDWCARSGARLPQVMKIDVEGAEDAVLRGGRETLARARPLVCLSLHGDRQREACRAVLSGLGYDVVSLQPGRAVDVASDVLAVPR